MHNLYHFKSKGIIPLILVIIIAVGLAVGGGIAIHSIKTKTNNWLNLILSFGNKSQTSQQPSNNQTQPSNSNQQQIVEGEEVYFSPFADSNGNWGYVDSRSTKVVIEPKYKLASFFSEGLAVVVLNDKWGFIDKTGRMVIEPKYEDARPFSEGLAAIELNDKWGYIDKTGKMVIEPKYYYAGVFVHGLADVDLNATTRYCINTKGEIVKEEYCER